MSPLRQLTPLSSRSPIAGVIAQRARFSTSASRWSGKESKLGMSLLRESCQLVSSFEPPLICATDHEGRAEEVESHKQDSLKKQKAGNPEWKDQLASDSESIVRRSYLQCSS